MAGRGAAIIGGGFGGLAAGIRLQAAGVQTTLFEACERPGGRAQVHRREGFVFDVGPTVITAPHCIEELFAIAGRRMEDYVDLIPVRPFYRLIWSDDTQIDYDGNLESEIRRLCPEDLDGYRRFVEYAERVFEEGYDKLGATPFLRLWDMMRVAPKLARLRADRSVYRVVSGFVRNEYLRQALSFHSLLIGGNPFETSAIYTLIHHLERKWGVFFPRGGTGALVDALVRLYTEIGGELRVGTPVWRVHPETCGGATRHRIVTRDGAETFDVVVSNADVYHTYTELLDGVAAAERTRRRLRRLDWSMSLFVLCFGTDRTYTEHVPHHTVLFGPRYRELLRDIFRGSHLPNDFSLYLHAPTATDPSFAPHGCGSFYVLSPVPHLGNAPLDWDHLAPVYADRILGSLERILPNLRHRVVTREWITPHDFHRRLRARYGSAFSCSPKLTQSAWFRPHNRDPQIPGLYIVGAGTHPGAGVPGVVNSAKATAAVILDDLVQRDGAARRGRRPPMPRTLNARPESARMPTRDA